ncbi:MAG: radical SAM protein [Firmicutes bacterium]|nr:radical SAM protein [Bacillota bacterium]
MWLFRRQARTRVLGPEERAVLWLQGCPLACPGCLVPESWDPRAVPPTSVDEVVARVLAYRLACRRTPEQDESEESR